MRAKKILLVDDSDNYRLSVTKTLGRVFSITEVASESEFRKVFRPYTFDLIILDMRLESKREGLNLLREVLTYDKLQAVIMISAYGDTDAVLDSAEAGALMFLHKQELTPELLSRVVEGVLQQAKMRRQLVALQNVLPRGNPLALTGNNLAMRRVAEQIRDAAASPESKVMVIGEQGGGHVQVAQAIHHQSRSRNTAPFVIAGGAPASGLEAERMLFGASRNTGSPRQKGLLEQANFGVLFLDGFEKLTSGVSEKFTTTLRKRRLDFCYPPIPLDLQLVVAARPDTSIQISESLQHEGNVDRMFEIYLPSLRERREDIRLLAASYLQAFNQDNGTFAKTIASDALDVLESYAWPGNLIELQNAVEHSSIQAMVERSEEVLAEHLPINIRLAHEAENSHSWDYRYHVAQAEVSLVEKALKEKTLFNNTQLAGMLNYGDRFAIARRMRKLMTEHDVLSGHYPLVAQRFMEKFRTT